MMYQKCEKRIAQYIDHLEMQSYTERSSFPMQWAMTEQRRTEEVFEGEFQDMEFPFSYATPWVDYWFVGCIAVPSDHAGRLFLLLDTETDTMVFIDGKVYGAVNPFHPKIEITSLAGKTITLHLQAWSGHRFPGFHPSEGGRVQACVGILKHDYPLVFSQPKLLQRNEEVYQLYYDALTLFQLSKTLNATSFYYQRLVKGLYDALSELSLVEDPSSKAGDVRNALRPLLEAKNGSIAPMVLSVGSSHIDHAWLWPISETIRKAARTALNMVNFINEDSDFIFMSSQIAQMEAIQEEYPNVFEAVQQAFKKGQWEPNGVCYIEPDCMLSSGESLIRQNLIGRRTTAKLFDGYEGDTFYLPDSFGYTAALPQILVGCRVKYFVTSKLSWNDTNHFPYDLFLWESLDGTRICSHMIQGAYEGKNDPLNVYTAYESIQHKDLQHALFRPVGEGDGGGGTRRSDLEFIKRQADLQGLPKNRWTSLSLAMQEIFKEPDQLPVYKGELYLELHRGTYTSQAKLKQANRKLEGLLSSYEYLSSLLFAQGEDVSLYTECLHSVWKKVLVNQFHDILPGSSVQIVNAQALASYQEAEDTLKQVFSSLEGPYLLNCNGYDVCLDDQRILKALTSVERTEDSQINQVMTRGCLSTDWANIELNERGQIISLTLNKNGQELVEKGRCLNQITLGEDYPVFWDAWDIDADSLTKQKPVVPDSLTDVAEDAYRYYITTTCKLGKSSSLTQVMQIYKHQSKIIFDTSVDWQETHQLLRVEFPTTLRSDKALYDVPFGYIERATHTNTSFEQARFEVPAHRFAALREGGHILSLASDSKYGYHVQNSTLSLSLLRSPVAPDPEADKGLHHFCYALLFSDAGMLPIQSYAALLNKPPISVDKVYKPLLTVEPKSVIVETVKVSEDGSCLVVRIRETQNEHAEAVICYSEYLDVATLKLANMLEEPIETDALFAFKPFEVKTYRIERRK